MSSNLQVIFTNKDDIQQCEVKYEDIPSTLNESRFKNQVLAILIGITGSMQYGFTISFTATFLPQITEYDNITTLENTESALNINTETGSWLASCVVLSIMIGLTTASLLVQRYKRKFLLIISNFPWLMGWILLTIAYNVSFIITGCICVGLSAGFNKAIVQIYLVEITEPRLCKTLLSFVLSGISAGILVSHVIGILLHWKTVYLIFFFISTVSLILSFFIRETPYWLVFNGELTKARDNFFNLREVTTKNVNEFNKLLDKEWQNIRKSRRIVPENVLSKKFAKIILLLFLIHTVLTGSGYNIMSYYTIYVLRGISQSLNIKTSLILLDTVSICSSLISYYALKLTNRKTLFLISSLGCFVSLSLASALIEIKIFNAILYGLICCSYMWFVYSGLLPVSNVILSEIFPESTKVIGNNIIVIYTALLQFLVVKTSPYMMRNFGEPFAFGIYACIVLICSIVLYFIMPETKIVTIKKCTRLQHR